MDFDLNFQDFSKTKNAQKFSNFLTLCFKIIWGFCEYERFRTRVFFFHSLKEDDFKMPFIWHWTIFSSHKSEKIGEWSLSLKRTFPLRESNQKSFNHFSGRVSKLFLIWSKNEWKDAQFLLLLSIPKTERSEPFCELRDNEKI